VGTTGTWLDPLDGAPLLDPVPARPDPALLPLSEGLPLVFPAPLETLLPDPDADEPDVPVLPLGLPVLGAGLPPLEHATSTVPTTILATTSHDFDLIGVLRPSETRPYRTHQSARRLAVHRGGLRTPFLVTRRDHRCKQLFLNAANIVC
jgi:hypothetical protein